MGQLSHAACPLSPLLQQEPRADARPAAAGIRSVTHSPGPGTLSVSVLLGQQLTRTSRDSRVLCTLPHGGYTLANRLTNSTELLSRNWSALCADARAVNQVTCSPASTGDSLEQSVLDKDVSGLHLRR